MDPTGQSLLKLLFNEGETVCVSKNKFGYHSLPLENIFKEKVTLLSPNNDVPISECNSSDLLLVAINPIQGFRLDSNVYKFRTFLWECDTGSIKDQIGYFKHLKLPLSAQIFSGNKSVHAITVLDEDLPDEKTYRYLYNWALKVLTMCDPACKNPSRSVRIPGVYREPGKKQRLISLNGRIKLKDFMDWLNQYDHLRPKVKEKKEIPEGEADFSRLSAWAKIMLTKGIVFKSGRNRTWYGLAYDLALAGFTEEQTIEILGQRFQEESDFKEKEWLTTIKSAFDHVKDKR